MNNKLSLLILFALLLATAFAQDVDLLEHEKINNTTTVAQDDQQKEQTTSNLEVVNLNLRKVKQENEKERRLEDGMDEEMQKQAALMEEKLKQMGKKKPIIKKDADKKVFNSADYYKDREDSGKN
ncbi:hypothetical protein TTHERM_00749000 (macronuclear) [Tetrahymena thermophila SB210]|uniref:Transmembrane protein n=1 Tax=Tetrahymena thermophila (strain SB210) TaxID=312017 RepID=Q239S8_TETTS|nr:hypothetical protein TTHERM_00749000 [Tetrahymena thermophila SB210]EAR93330.1 hypothetical protein TTHERM_00749000 [Tetrahymena thermophila SB210]|eukprot:XP_001013575.1 hypothetical protein TTHERM_00749000 [Tetrahymena thermophila SB210]